jgi:hypothetical protein
MAANHDEVKAGPLYRQKDGLKGAQIKAAQTLRACS